MTKRAKELYKTIEPKLYDLIGAIIDTAWDEGSRATQDLYVNTVEMDDYSVGVMNAEEIETARQSIKKRLADGELSDSLTKFSNL